MIKWQAWDMQQEVQLFLAIQKKKKIFTGFPPRASRCVNAWWALTNNAGSIALLLQQSAKSSGGVQGSVEAVQAILEEGGEETTLRIREWESWSQVSLGD